MWIFYKTLISHQKKDMLVKFQQAPQSGMLFLNLTQELAQIMEEEDKLGDHLIKLHYFDDGTSAEQHQGVVR